MSVLSEKHQQEIPLAYQRDYGSLILAYNKLGDSKPKNAMEIMYLKAISLHSEIINDTGPRKDYFNNENSEFARGIASAIQQFITTCLGNSDTSNVMMFAYNPNMKF